MYYGAQYYRPPFPEKECWERDMQNMKGLGFNCVKLWAVWNWIEQEQGSFDFSELDKLVELAVREGLKVIINTIPEGAPYWTYRGNKEDLYRMSDGRVVEYGGPANLPSGGWPGLCMDQPQFAQQVSSFIEETARHFSEHPAVCAIDVWNEPHLEPMYDYRDQLLCYCGHSKQEFTRWLQKKYKTLESLNLAWYRTYQEWNQVTPPPRFGTWADMMDWRKFWLENLQRWLRIRVDACRKGAPDMKVQTHVAYSGVLGNRIAGGLANELGDEFLLAKEVDIFGLSSFPKWLMGEAHIYRHLLHSEMIAEAAHGKVFYQVELQGGAGKPGLLGGEVPNARDVTLWNWNTILAGGKGSVYWQYAPEPAGVESPGFGLTGFMGENTERSLTAEKMARQLQTPELEYGQRVLAVNAVYVSRNSDLLCFCSERREEMYAGSISGVYQAAYRRSIPIRFFHEDYLEELPESEIQFLYLPMTLVLSERELVVFRTFVERGGTLVAEAGTGLYRPDGQLELQQKVLKELFGVTHKEIQGIPNWGQVSAVLLNQDRSFTGRFYRQIVNPSEDCLVLAKFEDGEAAVTERRLGDGKAVWIGTYVGYDYEYTHQEASGDLLRSYMNPAGYSDISNIHVTETEQGEIPLAPVIRMLGYEGRKILTAVNHTHQPVTISVELSRPSRKVLFELEPSEGKICTMS